MQMCHQLSNVFDEFPFRAAHNHLDITNGQTFPEAHIFVITCIGVANVELGHELSPRKFPFVKSHSHIFGKAGLWTREPSAH
jgi:hypothetical protein